jgi:hypothetical protein
MQSTSPPPSSPFTQFAAAAEGEPGAIKFAFERQNAISLKKQRARRAAPIASRTQQKTENSSRPGNDEAKQPRKAAAPPRQCAYNIFNLLSMQR